MKALFPQLASPAELSMLNSLITNDAWVLEQKLDGHRLFLYSASDTSSPTATTRQGTVYTRGLPREITDFRFPPGEWLLDGEFVGKTFWAFDLLIAGGHDLSGLPLVQRRAGLETLLMQMPSPFRVVPQARTREDKIKLADRALREGFEGLLAKRYAAPYRSAGRTEDWLKLKFVSTVDVVVTDVRADGKESVGYEVYDHLTGEPIDIGRASLIGKEKRGKINVGDVIEVRYLYVGADGRLYQPTILRKRDDKLARDCTNDQLRHVNKEVLEAL